MRVVPCVKKEQIPRSRLDNSTVGAHVFNGRDIAPVRNDQLTTILLPVARAVQESFDWVSVDVTLVMVVRALLNVENRAEPLVPHRRHACVRESFREFTEAR